jgi:hypothetical protein
MPPRRVDILDKIVIGICLLWLVGWIATGFLIATEIYWRDRDPVHARRALAVFGVGAAVGSIALIGLWPHRWLLRHDKPNETKGRAFEVKRP